MTKARKPTTRQQRRAAEPAQPQLSGVSPELQSLFDIHDRLPRGDWNTMLNIRNRHGRESAVAKNVDAAWADHLSSFDTALSAAMAFPARGYADIAAKLEFFRRSQPAFLGAVSIIADAMQKLTADATRLARPHASDERLLALTRECETAHEVHKALWLRFIALSKAAKEEADTAGLADEAWEARQRFRDQRTGTLYTDANAASKTLGKLAREVFALKAQTVQGVLAKLRIVVMLAQGIGEEARGGDLDTYQGGNRDWLAETLADLERLAKGGAA